MPDELDDWDYTLPPAAIADRPAARRDHSRLLHIPRSLAAGEALTDHRFDALPGLLQPGDLVVANDSAVLPARLRCQRASGGRVEVLLLELGERAASVEALVKPARRLKAGETLAVDGLPGAEVCIAALPDAEGVARVVVSPAPLDVMLAAGAPPLPPYIARDADADDVARYQTVFAAQPGSAAAPTAGLHLTPEVIGALADRGVDFATVTLHVGLGTFRPLRPEELAARRLHAEPWSVPEATASAIAAARARGGRVVAVGTTTVRTLMASSEGGVVRAGHGTTELFLAPPDPIPVIDGLITNFHLPRSSLLMLVACLIGRERLLEAYATALQRGYRFASYGDAMLIL